ncbi:MAG: NUDIX hydrolase [Variibacter sp.]|nr:NUDIX hydrolase [Variibacter sp.]
MTIAMTESKIVHDGWARFLVARFKRDDGVTLSREIEDHGAAVAVLPFDPHRRLALLVSQFRAPVFYAQRQDHLMEAIAGLLESDAPAQCAAREAYEEAGVRLRELEHVGTCWTMPGLSTERMFLYLAPYTEADRIGAGGGLPHEHEDIAVREIPLQDLAAMADRGAIADMKTLLLVQTLRLRRPDLFG